MENENMEKRTLLADSKNLVTVKKAHELTGNSIDFFRRLLRNGKLRRYKVNTSTFLSLAEFEELASKSSEQSKQKTHRRKSDASLMAESN